MRTHRRLRPLFFAALTCVLAGSNGRADASDGSHGSLCRRTDATSVATERELRQELHRAEGGGKIILNATEWMLKETLEIDSSQICLEGVTNGVVVHCPPEERGSAVVVRSTNAMFSNLTFAGCRGHSAVAIEATAANNTKVTVVFDRVRFSQNGDGESEVFGGAVRADSCRDGNCTASFLRFTKCRFSGNRALIGGAIFARYADVVLKDCDFEGNEARLSGGAIYISGMHEVALKTNRVNFIGNAARGNKKALGMPPTSPMLHINETLRTAGMGGAIYASNIARLVFKHSDFTKNVACEGGGAIAVFSMQRLSSSNLSSNLSRPFRIENGTFLENEAFCGAQPEALRLYLIVDVHYRLGGALRFEALNDESQGWHIKNSDFLGNRAHTGGAVCLQSNVLSATEHLMERCVFDGNIALMRGGAIEVSRIRLTMKSSNITNGRSLIGGGIHSHSSSRVNFVQDTNDLSVDSIIAGNVAKLGGGIETNDCAMDLVALTLRNNTAYWMGGGIFAEDTREAVYLRGITVEDNRSPAGGGAAFRSMSDVIVTSYNGRPTVFRNNTSSAGGGLLYDCGDTSYYRVIVENSSFVGNRALPVTDSGFATVMEEGYTFDVYPPALVEISSAGDQIDHSTNLMHILGSAVEGHGGGIALSLVKLRPSTIIQILFQNVVIEENEAVVGGGISSDMIGPYWNRDDRPSCAFMIMGVELCQKFEVRNVTITKNKAEFSGGVYVSYVNGIVASCLSGERRLVVHRDAGTVTGTDIASRYCSNIQGNTRIDGEENTAEAGTRAVQLRVEGGRHQLKQVASGDALVLPCDDEPNSSCSVALRIHVKDGFDQTIDGGIEDANLDVSIISDAIVGEQRYSAVKGIVTIDNTQAWGVNRSSTVTIVSERDRSIKVDLHLSTRECYPGEIIHENVCNECPTDQYSFVPSRKKCESCEKKAKCSGGAVLVPREGYWHSTPFSPVFHKCSYFTACRYDRRREKLMQFYEDPAELTRQLDRLDRYLENGRMDEEPKFSDYQQCDEGYGGPLCGSCQQGYGHSYTGACEACPEERSAARLHFFFAIVFLFLLVGTNCIITLMSSKARVTLAKYEMTSAARAATRTVSASTLVGNPSTISTHLISGLSDFSDVRGQPNSSTQLILAQQLVATVMLTETLKILINYLQVTGAALYLQAEWSTLLKSLLQTEVSLVGSLTAVVSVPYECCHQDSNMSVSIAASWMRLAIPWIVLSGLLITLVTFWAAFSAWIAYKQKRTAEDHNPLTAERLLTFVIIISIVSAHFNFIDVVRELLKAVNCVDMADAYAEISFDHSFRMYATETVDHTVWAEDTERVCFQGSHLPLGIIGIIGLIASFLGIISIILWLPLNKKHKGEATFIARYWFLFQAYRHDWYTVAWESIILVRKSMIAAAVVFSVHMTPILQASICTGVLTIALAAHAIFMPFKSPEDHPNVPDYAGSLFRIFRLPSLAKRWISLNNAIDLNVLEIVSLAASASIFYSAIVLHDDSSSDLGRLFMTHLVFSVNVFFMIYLLYRLYAGLHVMLDLKLKLNNAYTLWSENNMGPFILAVKAHALFQIWRNDKKEAVTATNISDTDPEAQPTEK